MQENSKNVYNFQFIALAREHPWLPPRGSCRRRKAVTDEGKTCTNFTGFSLFCFLFDPHPTSLRSATFPQGKAFRLCDKHQFTKQNPGKQVLPRAISH